MHTRYPWLRSVAGALSVSLGLSLAITSSLGWIGLEATLVCVIITLVVSLLTYLNWKRQVGEFRNAFGLPENSAVNIVLATYQNRVAYDPAGTEDKINRYFKEPPGGKKKYLQGARKYILGLDTAATAIGSVIELGRLTTAELNVLGDEEPRRAKEGPIISLGSPTSNNMTGEILDLLPGDRAVKFSTDSLTCWISSVPYKSTPELDYAVLARTKRDDQLRFACAGIDEEGTVAVTRHLLRNWQKLPQSNFVHVFKCVKLDLSLEKIGEATF